MHGCVIFCFGLVYLTSWFNMIMVVALLVRLDLSLLMISFSSLNAYSGTIFNIIMLRRSLQEPRRKLTDGLDLYRIVVMSLTTEY